MSSPVLSKGHYIILPPLAVRWARSVAKLRRGNRQYDGDEDRDDVGAIGELAMFYMLDMFPMQMLERDVKTAASGQDAGDLVLRDGRTVDVKATCSNETPLRADAGKENSIAEWYALVQVRFNYVENGDACVVFVGAAPRHRLISDGARRFCGKGSFFELGRAELVDL